MMRVVMFDLGQTLIDEANQQRPFPHAIEALTTITKAKPAPAICLVRALFSQPDQPVQFVVSQILFTSVATAWFSTACQFFGARPRSFGSKAARGV